MATNIKKLNPKNEVIKSFFDNEILQFGKFTLKSGKTSPYYFDLRKLVSSPDGFKVFGEFLSNYVIKHLDNPKNASDKISYDHVAGVPYGGIPFAVQLGERLGKSILMPRKAPKDYGNKKSIEGSFEIGDEVLLLEDTVTTGESCIETIKMIEASGLLVSAVIVIMDREEGGAENIENLGYPVYALFNMSNVIDIMHASMDLIDEYQYEAVLYYINVQRKIYVKEITKILVESGIEVCETDISSKSHVEPLEYSSEMSHAMKMLLDSDLSDTLPNNIGERLDNSQTNIVSNEVVKQTEVVNYRTYSSMFQHQLRVALIDLIIQKKSTLCLSLDYSSWEKCKILIEECGEYIVMVKVHVELFEDYTPNFGKEIKELAKRHKFFVMEDRKCSDVDNISFRQMMGGYFKIDEWASFVTMHGLTFKSCIDYYTRKFKGCSYPSNVSPVVVAQMNSIDNLLDKEYTKKCLDILEEYSESSPVIICQSLPGVSDRLKATPGVVLENKDLVEGRAYRSVETAIEVEGNHIIIVGSAIIFDENPADMARQFAEKSWQSFETCNPSLIDECKNFLEDLVDYSKRRAKSNYVVEECLDILE